MDFSSGPGNNSGPQPKKNPSIDVQDGKKPLASRNGLHSGVQGHGSRGGVKAVPPAHPGSSGHPLATNALSKVQPHPGGGDQPRQRAASAHPSRQVAPPAITDGPKKQPARRISPAGLDRLVHGLPMHPRVRDAAESAKVEKKPPSVPVVVKKPLLAKSKSLLSPSIPPPAKQPVEAAPRTRVTLKAPLPKFTAPVKKIAAKPAEIPAPLRAAPVPAQSPSVASTSRAAAASAPLSTTKSPMASSSRTPGVKKTPVPKSPMTFTGQHVRPDSDSEVTVGEDDRIFVADRTKEEHLQFFRRLIARETGYLTENSDKWEKFLPVAASSSSALDVVDATAISDEGSDAIHLAVGQARLFRDKKLQQFVGLVDDYEHERGERATSPTDLAGFWEMIYAQVINIRTMFGEVETLAANNWTTPEASFSQSAAEARKAAAAKRALKPMHNKPKSVVEGKSKIREAIAQARRGKPATETKPGDEAAVVSEVVAATEPATM